MVAEVVLAKVENDIFGQKIVEGISTCHRDYILFCTDFTFGNGDRGGIELVQHK